LNQVRFKIHLLEKLAELEQQISATHTTYEDSVIRANSILAKYSNQYKSMANLVKELEDKKTELLKSSLNQYANLLRTFSAVCLAQAENLQKQANSIVALKMEQISTNKSNEKLASHLLEPIKYLDKKVGGNQMKEMEVGLSKASIGILCKKIFSGEGGLSSDEWTKLTQSLKRPEAYEIIMTSLISIVNPVFFKSEAAFKDASKLCVELIKLDNYKEDTVNAVLTAGKHICIHKPTFKQMYKNMGDMWEDPKQWKRFLDSVIEVRSKSEDIKMVITNALSNYSYYLGNTCKKTKEINEFMKEYVEQYGINGSKISEILIEVTITQPINVKKTRNAEEALIVHKRRLEKYGNTPLALVIGKAIEYINDVKVLRSVLILNRSLNKTLKYYVYYAAFWSLKIPGSYRLKVWEQLLSSEPCSSQFHDLKQEYLNNVIVIC